MATQTKENYLKALYYLFQEGKVLSITDLGKMMQVSKPTVNNMVKRLKIEGWVEYEKYKPLTITKLGIKTAAKVVRRHRLSEMYLSQIMGFGWEQVHDIAEEMEHISSQAFFDRMDEILGFPVQDPHGSPIPDKSGNYVKPNYKALSNFNKGKFVLKALHESSSEFLSFLNKKEIKLEVTLDVLNVEDFDKSVTVSYLNHKNVTLSHAVCNKLLVQEKR